MKYYAFGLLMLVMVASSCHRKTVASSTSASHTKGTPLKPLLSNDEAEGTTSTTEPVVATRPMIIVDARGNFSVSDSTLPAGASKDILNPANARAYTPAQTKTLAYRFGKVPPRILYVPESYQKKSAKGTYYVLEKKFWYWKKSNGYFYIDENYFK